VNVSEGRDEALIADIAEVAGAGLLDVHSDAHHNRTVLTLGGPRVLQAARDLTRRAVATIDIRVHSGVHPRLGAVDVVPFVPGPGVSMAEAIRARDEFAAWAGEVLALPAFVYGPERSLPDVRRRAFRELSPDFGPGSSHRTAGACCVGARSSLVAWNAWLGRVEMSVARRIVRELRAGLPGVRALAFDIDGSAQVSCNLIEPEATGPDQVYDFVNDRSPVVRSELVGLIPEAALVRIPRWRWELLDLGLDRTIESRLTKGSGPPSG
jgi:glutamate formiminotransferase